MVIATGTGEIYQDRFDMISRQFQPAQEGSDDLSSGQKQAKLEPESNKEEQELMSKREDMHSGFDAHHPKGGSQLQIDRDHHVPLLASAIMDDSGSMTGLAIDHRANLSGADEELLHLHEATELPYMNDLVKGGMKPNEAYTEAHKWATARETAASIAKWGEEGHEAYKDRMRDAASIARTPTDRERHPDAHTTKYALDESELGHVINFPKPEEPKPPLQIDLLSGRLPGAVGIHSGPGATRMQENKELATKVDPKLAKTLQRFDKATLVQSQYNRAINTGINKKIPANENYIRTQVDAMEDLVTNNPSLYNYYRAVYKQKGGKDWESWKKVEDMIEGPYMGEGERPSLTAEPEGRYGKRTKGLLEIIEGGKE